VARDNTNLQKFQPTDIQVTVNFPQLGRLQRLRLDPQNEAPRLIEMIKTALERCNQDYRQLSREVPTMQILCEDICKLGKSEEAFNQVKMFLSKKIKAEFADLCVF
jgi:hypothetical protein